MGAKRLSIAEREEIAIGVERGDGHAEIARRIGRDRSTVFRELQRNTSPSPRAYRAFPAHIRADARARRPKPHKLVGAGPLRAAVVDLLAADYSPQQAAGRLKRDHPDRPEMHVCHETIYQALYVQGRNNLRAELKQALAQGRARCGQRARRRPRHRAPARPRFDAMVNISERPPEAEDRAVPGHWEGDLVIGKDGASQIATLAERSSRFTLLIALGDRTAATVSTVLADHARRLPDQFKRSLAWDQGIEMAAHGDFTLATDIPVFFCDPHSPWQRGTNENTNRLIRYYFPKGVTDFSQVSQEELDTVAHKLNTRPRKTLDYRTPAEALDEHLVATAV